MSRILVLHSRPDEADSHVKALREAGHVARALWPDGSPGLVPVRRSPPDAFVIDLGRQPSTGLALGTALRRYKDTRHVPLVFIAGDPARTARVRNLLPDAAYTSWRRLGTTLSRVLRGPARPARKPAMPDTMAGYSGTPLPKKLGVRVGSRVALLGAPMGFEKTLGPLPDGATVRRDARGSANVILLFVTSGRDLARRFPAAARAMGRPGALWIVWPKKASGVVTDLGELEVREFGLTAGLVDYKIAAIDATWSGLCFARRRPRR